MKNINIIKKKVRGCLQSNVSLKKYNTWKIGGNAEYLFEPYDIKDLQIFLNLTSDINITFIGNGSNVLIRDNGVNGCVICLKNTLNDYQINENEEFIFDAGLSCMKIAQITAKKNFFGLEFLCGIPGTLGGALAMNAGCYGGYIWEKISSVFLISKDGKILEKKKDDFVIKYRSVDINKNYFFLKARFKLSKNSFNNSNDLIKEYLKDRRSKQPTSLPSCGSVFKNPDNCHAAYLIDSIGLKGYKIGGAYISKKHANFIISDKTAKSIDVENLIYYVQQCVYEKKKIFLEPEVKFIGNK